MNNLKKTALIVTPYFPPHGGGLERYALEVTKRLQSKFDWRVVVVTSGERFGKDSVDNIEGITVYRLSYRLKISNTPLCFLWFKKIREIVKNENPDIVNIHMPVPGIGDIASTVIGKRPFVVTYHAGSMRKNKLIPDICVWLYEKWPMNWLLGKADKIICSSDFVRKNFLKTYLHKSVTITPAVDTALFKPAPEKKTDYPSILFVAGLGRAEQHKGLQTLIDATAQLIKKIPALKLFVVGEGDMIDEYKQRINNLGLEKAVIFTGKLVGEKLAEQYQKAHVFVLPTSNDSFSMVILEAMSTGLPVISCDVGSISSIVIENETGFLVPTNDSTAIVTKLEKLLNNQDYAQNIGIIGHKKIIEGYDWLQRAAEYDKIYNESIFGGTPKNKIGLVTPYFYPKVGGLENYALDMARVLKKNGKDVFVITSNHLGRGRRYEEFEGIRIYRLPILLKISNTPINPLWRYWIRKILQKEKPQIINAHTPVPYISDIAERVRGNIFYILTYHNDLEKDSIFWNFLSKLEYIFLSNKTLKRADMIISTSEYYAKHSRYLMKYLSKTRYVPPGVDVDRFKPGLSSLYYDDLFSGFKTVLFVGQIDKTHRHKGLDDLLRAISQLKLDIPTIKLVVVGRGDDIEYFRSMATELGVSDLVSFEGFVSDELLPQYYTGADVIVLPSTNTSEGFGMVVTEAAACETPAVATTVGGIPAAIIDGQTGLLVPPSNINKLATAIKNILLNAELSKKLGKQASKRVFKEFSLFIVANKYLELISEILEKNI